VNRNFKFPFVDTSQTKREDSLGQMKPEDLIVLKGVIALQKDRN
jgi:uridine kinase